jgi:hypothetical protein
MAREATNAWSGAAPAARARLTARRSTRAQGGGLVPNGVGESQEVALSLHFAFSPPPKCFAVWAHLLARPGARPRGSGARRSSRARPGQGTASGRPSWARHAEARDAGEGGRGRHVLLRDAPVLVSCGVRVGKLRLSSRCSRRTGCAAEGLQLEEEEGVGSLTAWPHWTDREKEARG